jgi:hypothetical protein
MGSLLEDIPSNVLRLVLDLLEIHEVVRMGRCSKRLYNGTRAEGYWAQRFHGRKPLTTYFALTVFVSQRGREFGYMRIQEHLQKMLRVQGPSVTERETALAESVLCDLEKLRLVNHMRSQCSPIAKELLQKCHISIETLERYQDSGAKVERISARFSSEVLINVHTDINPASHSNLQVVGFFFFFSSS